MASSQSACALSPGSNPWRPGLPPRLLARRHRPAPLASLRLARAGRRTPGLRWLLGVVALTGGLLAGPRPTAADNPNPGLLQAALRSLPKDAGERTAAPYLFVSGAKGQEQLPLKHVRAEVRIAGTVAEVVITQQYDNEGDQTLEALYLFPASTRAAVHAMRMWVGDREVVARIARRADARQEYEAAVQDGRTASLLEQQRPNVFQMSVGHIRPGDEVQIQLSYTEVVLPDDGVYEFVLPQVVGPRYAGGTTSEEAAAAGWVANPYLAEGEPAPYGYEASVLLLSGVPIARIASPSHEIEVQYKDPRSAEVLLGPDPEPADFVLRYGLQGDQINEGLLVYPEGDGGYFMLTVQPPERTEPDRVLPHELLFVVDVSGSMTGFPAETSEALIKDLLGGLRERDRFNLLLFAGASAVLSERSLPADEANIRRAQRMLAEHGTGGATNLLPALRRALALPRESSMARSVVLLTDGYVHVEQEAFELVRKELGQANLFAFGIGSSVNRFLVEGLARAGQGEPFVAANPDEARRSAEQLRTYVAAPLMRRVQVEFEGWDTYDLEPRVLPDLFASRPLVVMGRYRGEPQGRALVTGLGADGELRAEIPLDEAVVSSEGAALRRLWARTRIARIADLELLAPNDERVHQVTELGLQHSLVTQHTSFVAVDSVARPDGSRRSTVRQPLPLPQGVSQAALGGGVGAAVGNAGILRSLGSRGAGTGGGGMVGSFGLGAASASGSSGYGRAGRGALSLRGRRSARVSPPAVRSGRVVVMGALSRDVIRRVFRKHQAEVRACYEEALQRKPGLAGKVIVQLEIAADGTVASVKLKQCDIDDETFRSKLLARIKRWRFPAPRGGGLMVVNYPYIFRATP